MPEATTVLLLGGTGRTGGRVLQQLLDRGVTVRAIVRSAERLPEGVAGKPGLTVIEADLCSLPAEDLRDAMKGCEAVISCLGHNINMRGLFGPPRDLCTQAVVRVAEAARSLRPAEPVKLVLMSSVSVHVPDDRDARRGTAERAALWAMRGLVPPARDNQSAADALRGGIGVGDPYIQWVAVRPDSLVEGDVSEYAVHEGLVAGLARPDKTAMASVAHFMCELVTDPATWETWRGGLPVVVNGAGPTPSRVPTS